MHLNDHDPNERFHRTAVIGEHIWNLFAPSTSTVESIRAVRSGPCPVRVWISQGNSTISRSNLFQFFTTPQVKKGRFLCLNGFSCISICAASLFLDTEKTLQCVLYSLQSDVYICWWDPSWAFSSPDWTFPALSASPSISNTPSP